MEGSFFGDILLVFAYRLSQWVYRKGGKGKRLLSLVLAKYGKFCKSGVFFGKGLYKSVFLVYYIEKWLEVARSGKEWLKNQWDAMAVAISAEIKASRAKELLLKKNCTVIPALRPKNGGRDRTLNL